MSMIDGQGVRQCGKKCGFETTDPNMKDCVCGARMADVMALQRGVCVLCGQVYDSDAQPITMFFGEGAHLTCLDPNAFSVQETSYAFEHILLGKKGR